MRWLMGSIPDWYALFAEAFKTLRPGGWVESFEASSVTSSDHAVIPPDSALGQWGRFFVEGGERLGRTFTVVEDDLQKKAMQAAGFVDIHVVDIKVSRWGHAAGRKETDMHVQRPLGPWPKDPALKEVGALSHLALDGDAEGYVLYMASVLGWQNEEIQVYLAHFRREIRGSRLCPYNTQRIVWGRKPE